jgi:hypothetical protein
MFSAAVRTNLFTDFLEEEGQAIIARIIQQTKSVAVSEALKGLLGGIDTPASSRSVGATHYPQADRWAEPLLLPR